MNQMHELIRIVSDVLENETRQHKYNREIRKNRGLPPDSMIWISSLSAKEAYRLGELTERCSSQWSMLADICKLLNIDQTLLIAAVKSINRWEQHGGRWDRGISPSSFLSYKDEKPLLRFVTDDGGAGTCYQSTGRKKAWCE